jgi:radical SAM superfamily enzyme YgiQ (UPF0313 family)
MGKMLFVAPSVFGKPTTAQEVGNILPPLGISYLAAVLENAGHTVEIIDLGVEHFDITQLATRTDLSIIGFSCNTPNVGIALRLARKIKGGPLPEIPIIFGGVHPTIMPDEVMKNDCVDIVVRGEAENIIVSLVESLEDGKSLDEIPGISYRTSRGLIKHNKLDAPIQDLDSIPFPARHLLKSDAYKVSIAKSNPCTAMITSRGCPYNCIYCFTGRFFRKCRFRSVPNVLSEIKEIVEKYKIHDIEFYDDTFTLNRKRAIEICQGIKKEKFDITWRCRSRVDHVDRELLEEMKKAGCYAISYGIESANQKMLDTMQKGITVDQQRTAIEITKKAKIEVLAYFIFGTPGETERSIKDSINFMKETDPDYVSIAIMTPFPGTHLFEMANEKGWIETLDWEEYRLGSPVMRIPTISQSELVRWQKQAYKEFYFRARYILRHMRKIKNRSTAFNTFRSLRSLIRSIWLERVT